MNVPYSITLLPHERIIYQSRTHWLNWVLPFMGAFFATLGFAVRLRFYGEPLILNFKASFGISVSYRLVSLVETAVLAFLAVVFFLKGFHQICARYIITTARLIHHCGFLNVRTTELRLFYCSNITMQRNLPGMIFGYGDFGLRAGGVDMFFNDVPHPKVFHRTLTDAIGKAWEAESETGNDCRPEDTTAWLEKELGMRP